LRTLPLTVRILSGFLRVFFKLLYHQFAWTYDLVAAAVSLGMWQDWVRLVLPYLPGPRVLELGHGPGHLQVALNKAGVQVFGLDESRQMGCLAFRRIERFSFIPLLVNGYAQFTPFSNSSFNQVTATFPSEYIVDPHSLAEIYRILAPGGSLIILPLAWITGRQPHERFAAWLFRFTKQAPDFDVRMTEPFRQAGFDTKTTLIPHRSSTSLLILATKPLTKRHSPG
jgi:ubiquinone/menaquinone biosynthesis C-methylase UbiE